MKKHLARCLAFILIVLLLPISSLQGVQASGVKVSVQKKDKKYRINVTSQESGKGIRIVAYSTVNGKTVNVTYAFDKKASSAAYVELDEYIRHIHDLGITGGYSDGTFKPNNTLTRAEAAVMLAAALNLKIENNNQFDKKFKDIKSHWAKKYINAVIKNGIMGGTSAAAFDPDNKITVAEVCTILSKSFDFKTKSQGEYTKLRKNQWYSGYVQNIFNLKILTPQDSIYKTFDESGYISRGNFAMMLSRALSTY